MYNKLKKYLIDNNVPKENILSVENYIKICAFINEKITFYNFSYKPTIVFDYEFVNEIITDDDKKNIAENNVKKKKYQKIEMDTIEDYKQMREKLEEQNKNIIVSNNDKQKYSKVKIDKKSKVISKTEKPIRVIRTK